MSAGSTKRTAAPTRRAEARALFHNAILEAAEQVFAERGFHAARIQDIAERARIAVGTVYNHFETKEAVLHGLLEERTGGLIFELSAAPGDPAGFEKKLVARVARILAYIGRHRGFFTVAIDHGLMGGASGAAAAALGGRRVRNVERFGAAFLALMKEGVDAGALAPLPPARLARFLGGSLRACLLGGLENEATRIEDDAPLIVSLFLHGAAKRPTRAPRRTR